MHSNTTPKQGLLVAFLAGAAVLLAGCTDPAPPPPDTHPAPARASLQVSAAWEPYASGGPAHLVATMRNVGNAPMDMASMMATMNVSGPMGPVAMEGMGGMGMMMQPGQGMSATMHPRMGGDGRMGLAHEHMGNETAMPPGDYTVCMAGQCAMATLGAPGP